jgi:DNA-binding SARP family transcriptional activator
VPGRVPVGGRGGLRGGRGQGEAPARPGGLPGGGGPVRGELLPADRYEAWAEDRREGLRQQYISLLLEIARLQEDDGQAIEALSKVVAEEPTHEGAHAGLMRLYARGGRREEALEQYGRLRRALGREFAG